MTRRRMRPGIDRKYLAFIRAQPCLLCRPGMQYTLTEAAHTGIRGLGQKAPDREAIPLCATHHRMGQRALHVLGKYFWQFHGISQIKIVTDLQSAYDGD